MGKVNSLEQHLLAALDTILENATSGIAVADELNKAYEADSTDFC